MSIKQNLMQSFGLVKKDLAAIRISFTDWVIFLKKRDDVLQHKIAILERRIAELEQQKNVIIY